MKEYLGHKKRKKIVLVSVKFLGKILTQKHNILSLKSIKQLGNMNKINTVKEGIL